MSTGYELKMHGVSSTVVITAPQRALPLKGGDRYGRHCAVPRVETVVGRRQVDSTCPRVVRVVPAAGDLPDVKTSTVLADANQIDGVLVMPALVPYFGKRRQHGTRAFAMDKNAGCERLAFVVHREGGLDASQIETRPSSIVEVAVEGVLGSGVVVRPSGHGFLFS